MEPIVSKNEPPPRRLSMREYLRALEIGENVFFPDAKHHSVRATVSQVKAEFKNRQFTVRKERDGVRVWRIKPDKER